MLWLLLQYPGATPEQVEEEVTLQLEKAIQRIPQRETNQLSKHGWAIANYR